MPRAPSPGFTTFAAASWACSHSDEVRFQQELDLPAGAVELVVEVEFGDITLVGSKTPQDRKIRIDAFGLRRGDDAAQLEALERGEMAFTLRDAGGGRFVLAGPAVPPDVDRTRSMLVVRASIEVPPCARFAVRAMKGHLAAQDIRGEVNLRSEHKGFLHLKNVRGDAVLWTGEGDVLVDLHRGGLTASVERNGQITATISALGAAGVRLDSHRGSIICFLPEDASFDLDAHTVLGKGANGFDIPVVREGEKGFSLSMRGRVGAGGPDVVLRTGEGTVSVGRSRPATGR